MLYANVRKTAENVIGTSSGSCEFRRCDGRHLQEVPLGSEKDESMASKVDLTDLLGGRRRVLLKLGLHPQDGVEKNPALAASDDSVETGSVTVSRDRNRRATRAEAMVRVLRERGAPMRIGDITNTVLERGMPTSVWWTEERRWTRYRQLRRPARNGRPPRRRGPTTLTFALTTCRSAQRRLQRAGRKTRQNLVSPVKIGVRKSAARERHKPL